MNAIIHQSLYTPNELMNQVVTNYLTVKGKQIRPIMVILSAGLFGNVNQHVLHAGAALEMLHNASLIHDDVVDATTLRRGRRMLWLPVYAPTISKLFRHSLSLARNFLSGKSIRFVMRATIISMNRAISQ